MNDYIERPDGQRVRWIRPNELARPAEVFQGQAYAPGVARIDQWLRPEPPESA